MRPALAPTCDILCVCFYSPRALCKAHFSADLIVWTFKVELIGATGAGPLPPAREAGDAAATATAAGASSAVTPEAREEWLREINQCWREGPRVVANL